MTLSAAPLMTDEQLDLLAEQFQTMQQMTFAQFIEAVSSRRIVFNAQELIVRASADYREKNQARLKYISKCTQPDIVSKATQ